MLIIGNKIVNKVDMIPHRIYDSGRESDNESRIYSYKMKRVLIRSTMC